ncbi:undecaprenyl-diphosphatase [Hymenobacter daecheongensis DSM 21074]|uniref:Undecaprenyl-diphosphatase n=1 Tax=Hymenobacter daecheongensis DSM 21074 TaxID=1121955 RepID=A0A1M6LSM2_9BACT|nr:phosphatase PAP2 family protein [Hymenobacter daecheongensis]SHJ74221.1 undecaprenyl-diphosphatase [Hymenobacter daecheongensis DSM 21074]
MKTFLSRVVDRLSFLTAEAVVLVLVFLGAFASFFYLIRVVFVAHSVALDTWAFRQLDALRQTAPGLTDWVQGITFFASAPFLFATAILLPAGLAWRRHRREALEVFLAIVGASALNQALKVYFHRVRPESALVQQLGLSFPSGHSMIGMALYGCLAWLLWRHGRHPAWAALLVLWVVAIGLTRIYLHVHYATDVLAGFAAGLVWLILLRTALRIWWREKQVLEASEEK